MTMFIWVFVLIGMAHSLKQKKLLHDKASKAMYSLIQKGRRLKLPTDIIRASKSPDFSGDLPIFDKIMKISRSPDFE